MSHLDDHLRKLKEMRHRIANVGRKKWPSSQKGKQVDPVSVDSSAISQLQFDERAQTVTITFNGGGTKTVPCDKSTYEQFVSAPSVGKFYNQHFRN